MFERLGGWIGRWWAAVIVFWALLLGVLEATTPSWDAVSHDGDLRYFPRRFASVRGQELLAEAFPEDFHSSAVVVIAHRERGPLQPADHVAIDKLFDGLVRSWHAHRLPIVRIRSSTRAEPPSTPEAVDALIGGRLTSAATSAGQATVLVVRLNTEFLEVRNVAVVRHVREGIESLRRAGALPRGLRLELAGPGAVGRDILVASDESVGRTTWTTVLLVTLILLVVYRAPVLALIPLVAIGVAVRVSLHLMAVLTQLPLLGLEIFKTTDIFIIVVLFGAGTDYCLFLLARFKEELLSGQDAAGAMRRAVGQVGGALVASAATVICGLGMMVAGEFGKFRHAGVAIALSLFVALCAALSLTPAMLRLFGRMILWPPWLQIRRSVGLWEKLSHGLSRRPAVIWVASVLVLAPLAILGTHPDLTYDLLRELSSDCPSVRGTAAFQRYFPAGELSPVSVLLDTRGVAGGPGGGDLRQAERQQALADLSAALLAASWQSAEGAGRVVEVRSLTRPLGELPRGGLLGAVQTAATRAFGAGHYVSSQPGLDGRVTRLEVVLSSDPFSKVSQGGLSRVEEIVQQHLGRSGSALAGAQYSLAGITAGTRDLAALTAEDQWRIDTLVAVGIFAVLLALLRRPGICLYLVASVLFGYFVTLGVTEAVFRAIGGETFEGLDWKLPVFLFTILVAVGEDYNIFLMSRVREEQAEHGAREGVRRALARTGGIISSCGLIMAGTFASLMTGSLSGMLQLGFALGFGVLLDTFVVRPILVPAFLLLVHRPGSGRRPSQDKAPEDGEPSFVLGRRSRRRSASQETAGEIVNP